MTFHKQIPSFGIATSQSLIYPVNLLNTLAADPSRSAVLGFSLRLNRQLLPMPEKMKVGHWKLLLVARGWHRHQITPMLVLHLQW